MFFLHWVASLSQHPIINQSILLLVACCDFLLGDCDYFLLMQNADASLFFCYTGVGYVCAYDFLLLNGSCYNDFLLLNGSHIFMTFSYVSYIAIDFFSGEKEFSHNEKKRKYFLTTMRRKENIFSLRRNRSRKRDFLLRYDQIFSLRRSGLVWDVGAGFSSHAVLLYLNALLEDSFQWMRESYYIYYFLSTWHALRAIIEGSSHLDIVFTIHYSPLKQKSSSITRSWSPGRRPSTFIIFCNFGAELVSSRKQLWCQEHVCSINVGVHWHSIRSS